MRHCLALLLISFSFAVYAQKGNTFGKLKKPNEQMVFSFSTNKSGKTAVLCRDADNAYLVYRFGNKDSVELAFPDKLDKGSWKKFKYYAYSRGGGPSNAAMYNYHLEFVNNNVAYDVYDVWSSEDDLSEIGIDVNTDKRKVKLTGNLSTQTGSLSALEDLSLHIRNAAFDE